MKECRIRREVEFDCDASKRIGTQKIKWVKWMISDDKRWIDKFSESEKKSQYGNTTFNYQGYI